MPYTSSQEHVSPRILAKKTIPGEQSENVGFHPNCAAQIHIRKRMTERPRLLHVQRSFSAHSQPDSAGSDHERRMSALAKFAESCGEPYSRSGSDEFVSRRSSSGAIPSAEALAAAKAATPSGVVLEVKGGAAASTWCLAFEHGRLAVDWDKRFCFRALVHRLVMDMLPRRCWFDAHVLLCMSVWCPGRSLAVQAYVPTANIPRLLVACGTVLVSDDSVRVPRLVVPDVTAILMYMLRVLLCA